MARFSENSHQHACLADNTDLHLDVRNSYDGDLDEHVLGPGDRSKWFKYFLVSALMALVQALPAVAFWSEPNHQDLVVTCLVFSAIFALPALVCLASTLSPEPETYLKVHLHFAPNGSPTKACILHDGGRGEKLLPSTTAQLGAALRVPVRICRLDTPIANHRTVICQDE